MSPAVGTAVAPLTPAVFCERLLAAVAENPHCDARDRWQHAILLRPFLAESDAAAAFEATLREHQARNSELAATAREVLALWRLCRS